MSLASWVLGSPVEVPTRQVCRQCVCVAPSGNVGHRSSLPTRHINLDPVGVAIEVLNGMKAVTKYGHRQLSIRRHSVEGRWLACRLFPKGFVRVFDNLREPRAGAGPHNAQMSVGFFALSKYTRDRVAQ